MIYQRHYREMTVYCSKCGFMDNDPRVKWFFCPNCKGELIEEIEK